MAAFVTAAPPGLACNIDDGCDGLCLVEPGYGCSGGSTAGRDSCFCACASCSVTIMHDDGYPASASDYNDVNFATSNPSPYSGVSSLGTNQAVTANRLEYGFNFPADLWQQSPPRVRILSPNRCVVRGCAARLGCGLLGWSCCVVVRTEQPGASSRGVVV